VRGQPRRDERRDRARRAGQAVRRRRSEAGDLSLPARRHLALRIGEAALARRRRAAAPPDDELPLRPRDPAGHQFGVRKGDDRRTPGAVRPTPAEPRGFQDAAGRDRAAGAEAVRQAVVAISLRGRGVLSRCRRRVHRSRDPQRLDRLREGTRRHVHAGPDRTAPHLPRVPSVPVVQEGPDAPLCPRSRSARDPARARRWPVVPRARGDRRGPQRAACDRVARRRDERLRDAARPVLLVHRRRSIRVPPRPPPATSDRVARPGTSRPPASPTGLAGRAHRDRGRALDPGQPAPSSQSPLDLRHARTLAGRDTCARRCRILAGWRAGTRERVPRDGHRAPLRVGWRDVVPCIHRAPRRRCRARQATRSTGCRGGHRGHAHHDGARGKGPRVPDRDPLRPVRAAIVRQAKPLHRQRAPRLARAARRLRARGAARARAGSDRS